MKLIDIKSNNECWVWLGQTDIHNYGRFRLKGRPELAHRISYRFHIDEIPDGINVLHRCDNPTCVNPNHLFLGTQRDNVEDMITKGRASLINPQFGSRNGFARLNEDDVREIKKLLSEGHSQRDIANIFGVVQGTIAAIKSGNTWRHV